MILATERQSCQFEHVLWGLRAGVGKIFSWKVLELRTRWEFYRVSKHAFVYPRLSEHAEWISIGHIPGNKDIEYISMVGARPMGVCRIKPGGYFSLHWHCGEYLLLLWFDSAFLETEHYLIVSGHGRFTIGSEEKDVIANGVSTNLTNSACFGTVNYVLRETHPLRKK